MISRCSSVGEIVSAIHGELQDAVELVDLPVHVLVIADRALVCLTEDQLVYLHGGKELLVDMPLVNILVPLICLVALPLKQRSVPPMYIYVGRSDIEIYLRVAARWLGSRLGICDWQWLLLSRLRLQSGFLRCRSRLDLLGRLWLATCLLLL